MRFKSGRSVTEGRGLCSPQKDKNGVEGLGVTAALFSRPGISLWDAQRRCEDEGGCGGRRLVAGRVAGDFLQVAGYLCCHLSP